VGHLALAHQLQGLEAHPGDLVALHSGVAQEHLQALDDQVMVCVHTPFAELHL
jgi:hypothetical protein